MTTINTNLKLKASAQFQGFSFNSFAKVGDKYIGANENGLFEVVNGCSDNGVQIDASFKTATSDLGTSNPKALRFMHLGFISDGDVLFTTSADEQEPHTFTVPANKDGLQRSMITGTRRQRGRYWSFEVENTEGADMAVESIEGVPIILNQGLKS